MLPGLSITVNTHLDQQAKTAELQLWPLPKAEQLEKLNEGVVPFFSDYANYDERLLNPYLSLLVQGLISP